MNVHVITWVFLLSALLRLRSENGTCAEETQFVKTICLPEGPLPDGSECTIAGWGATEKCKRDFIILYATFPVH